MIYDDSYCEHLRQVGLIIIQVIDYAAPAKQVLAYLLENVTASKKSSHLGVQVNT